MVINNNFTAATITLKLVDTKLNFLVGFRLDSILYLY